MKRFAFIILAGLLLAGCRSSKVTTTDVVTQTVTVTETDTVRQVVEYLRHDTIAVHDSVIIYRDAETGQTTGRETYRDVTRVHDVAHADVTTETREKETAGEYNRQKVTETETQPPGSRKTFADLLWIWAGKLLLSMFGALAIIVAAVVLIRKFIPVKILDYAKRLLSH